MDEFVDVNPTLVWLLNRAVDEWGATGVAEVAARMAKGSFVPGDPAAKVYHVTPPIEEYGENTRGAISRKDHPDYQASGE